MGDTLMLRVWDNGQDIYEIILTNVEINLTIIGLTRKQAELPSNIRGYVERLGEVVVFDNPRQTSDGSYTIIIRVSANIHELLRDGTNANDGRGGINWLSFEYHGLPYKFCIFCRRLGHKQEECNDYIQAQNLVQYEQDLAYPQGMFHHFYAQQGNMVDIDSEDELDTDNDSDSESDEDNGTDNSAITHHTVISTPDYNEVIAPSSDEEVNRP
ncbi:hypothetical protein MKX01_037300 [Papaver californicum]|nr:hypothetical protein MKX01_037300 [Papaver californicum]